MREVASWDFIPPIVSGSPVIVSASLSLDESQLNILWKVTQSGPKSLYQLSKITYSLPQKLNCRSYSNPHVWAENLKKGITYHRSFVFKVVQRLERKGLVKTEFRSSTVKLKKDVMPIQKKMVIPTLAGLILYLQNSELESSFSESMGLDKTEKERQKTENRNLVPFIDSWDFIIKQINDNMNETKKSNDLKAIDIGKKKCFKALTEAVQEFSGVYKVRFVVKTQNIAFEGYLEVPGSMILYRDMNVEVVREKDEQIAKLLKNPKLANLVRAYLAYLITKDIRKMSLYDTEEIPEALTRLDSEREFAFFRPELARQGSLFQGGRLKDYVPQYATLNYFFAGLFVKNLLWKETIKETKPFSGNNDYRVQFLDKG